MTVIKRMAPPWRLNPELIKRMKEVADKERRSQVDQVEIALEQWLDDHEKKTSK